MSSFTKPLRTEYIGRGLRKVVESFSYHVGKENSRDKVVVPAGFLTDFASVPWPASMLIPKDGDTNQAAVVHDYLYSVRGKDKKTKPPRTRAECDAIFLEAMTVLDSMKEYSIPLWKRRIMYRAVRIGGWVPWMMENKPEKEKSLKSK